MMVYFGTISAPSKVIFQSIMTICAQVEAAEGGILMDFDIAHIPQIIKNSLLLILAWIAEIFWIKTLC